MVLHPISATRIASEAIREVRASVFRRRKSTMIEEADRYNIHDFEVTLLSMRRDMRLLLETLPDAAFGTQKTTDDPVWSAGEIIGHVRHAQMNTFLRATRLAGRLPAGLQAERPDEDGVHPILSRAATMAALDEADRDLIALFESLTDDIDLDHTVEDEILGTSGVKDTLLFLAIHDDDHLGQLQELRDEGRVERDA